MEHATAAHRSGHPFIPILLTCDSAENLRRVATSQRAHQLTPLSQIPNQQTPFGRSVAMVYATAAHRSGRPFLPILLPCDRA